MTNVPAPINQKQALLARPAADLLAGLGKTVENNATEVYHYLAFTGREGRYTISKGSGATPEPFAEGTEVYLNLFDTQQEYVCWKNGTNVEKQSYSLFEQMPPIETMTDHGPYSDKPDQREGWKKQYSISLRDVTNNKHYRLNISAVSALKSFDAFIMTVLEQSTLHDIKAETPKVRLGIASFKSQGHRNYKPTFDLVSWVPNPKSPAEIAAEKAKASAAAVTATASATTEEDAPAKDVPASRRKA